MIYWKLHICEALGNKKQKLCYKQQVDIISISTIIMVTFQEKKFRLNLSLSSTLLHYIIHSILYIQYTIITVTTDNELHTELIEKESVLTQNNSFFFSHHIYTHNACIFDCILEIIKRKKKICWSANNYKKKISKNKKMKICKNK